MSFLDTLKDALSGFGKAKADNYVGIDIGSAYIKVTQLKKENGHLMLETYGEVALAPYDNERFAGELTNLDPEQMAEAIKNLLDQANVTSKNAVISISSATSLIFILKLPKISERELSGVVQNETRKYIPVPLTEVSLDWWIIPEKEIYGDSVDVENSDQKEVMLMFW